MTQSRIPSALVVLVVVAAAALSACGESASSGGPRAVVAAEEQDLLGRWTDAATGQELPDGTQASEGLLVVSTGAGSTTCTDDGTVFLQLAWPPGSEVDLFAGTADERNAPQFIRDTTGSAMDTVGTSDLDVTLPASAKATGFRRGGNTISVDVHAKEVYVIRSDGRTEHWARLRGGGCA